MFDQWNSLSFWADILSMVGFAVSCVTLWQIRHLKHRIAFNAGLPGLLSKLRSLADQLPQALDDGLHQRQEIHAELVSLVALLEYRKRRLPPQARELLKELQQEVAKPIAQVSADNGWGIYARILSLLSVLTESQADRAVGADDA